MCAQPASESSSLSSLYSQFESIAKKEKLTLGDEAAATKIAKKCLLSLGEHQGKVTFKAQKKPWGWGLWHGLQKFLGIRKKSYNFENFIAQARSEFAKTNLNAQEKEKLRVILNKTIDHVNESRKDPDKIALISAEVIAGSAIAPKTSAPKTLAKGAPPPPPKAGEAKPKSVVTEEKLQKHFPRKNPDFIKFLAAIPVIQNELALSQPDYPTLGELVEKLSVQYEKLQKAKASFVEIQQSASLRPVAERFAIAPLESWEKITSVDGLKKEIPVLNEKIALIELTVELREVAAKFDAVQERAKTLQSDPFFSSFCEHVLPAAKPILCEIANRTFIDDPHGDPSVKEPPFLDRESLERFKNKQEQVITQYERAVSALEGLKTLFSNNFSDPIASRADFLKKEIGATSIDEWTTKLEKAIATQKNLFQSIRGSKEYTSIYPHLTQDVAEISGPAQSLNTNGLWHIVLYKQNELSKNEDLLKYSLDEYVNSLIFLCEGMQNAHDFYTQLQGAETHISKIPQKSVFPDAKKFFNSLFSHKRSVNDVMYADDTEKKAGALTRAQIHEHVQRYKPTLKPQRINEIEKSKMEFSAQKDAVNERQRRLLGQSPLNLPVRLSTEKTSENKPLLRKIDELKDVQATPNLLQAVKNASGPQGGEKDAADSEPPVRSEDMSPVQRMLRQARQEAPEPEGEEPDSKEWE